MFAGELSTNGHTSWLNGAHGGHVSSDLQDGLVIYSALHDAKLQELKVFIEVESTIADEGFEECVLTTPNNVSTKLKASVTGFETRPEPGSEYYQYWRPLIVSCASVPSWAGSTNNTALTLRYQNAANQSVLSSHPTTVESISVEMVSDIGACIGPLFSEVPTFHDWLFYHWGLKVAEFNIYLPHGKFIDTENYTRYQGTFPEHGHRAKHHTTEFYSSAVWWRHYHPVQSSVYFAQTIIYNECVYRNRHRHRFLVMLDTDEFISVANSTLLALLDAELTSDYAGVLLPMSWHHVFCPSASGIQTYSDFDVFQDRKPDAAYFAKTKEQDWYAGGKSIIRPINVVTEHVHNPLMTPSGIEWGKRLHPSQIALKHVRCGSWS